MFRVMLFVLRAFVVGVVIGVLIAPRAGAETRRMLAASLALLAETVADLLGVRAEPAPLPERFEREPAERAARV